MLVPDHGSSLLCIRITSSPNSTIERGPLDYLFVHLRYPLVVIPAPEVREGRGPRPLWYGIRKVVPLALIEQHLTFFACAVWFCDDGCMQKQGAYLYTQAFSTCEVRALAETLERRFDLPASVLYRKGDQPFLRFPARVRPTTKELLASFALPGMSYKYQGP